jgi:hypothetical protein
VEQDGRYRDFDWPESLPEDQFWFSPELLSVHGTEIAEGMDEASLKKLARAESLAFYSANVHGIRDLLLGVVERIYTAGFEDVSENLAHFVSEENHHMWFFAEFCLRYGGIRETRKLAFNRETDPDVLAFLTFAQILIFEDVGHYYNRRMMSDERLPEIVRRINRRHYRDEARHIQLGRHLVAQLHRRMLERCPADKVAEVIGSIRRYVRFTIESFYEPAAYRDAALAEPLRLRALLLSHPARRRHHREVTAGLARFFETTLEVPIHDDVLF